MYIKIKKYKQQEAKHSYNRVSVIVHANNVQMQWRGYIEALKARAYNFFFNLKLFNKLIVKSKIN